MYMWQFQYIIYIFIFTEFHDHTFSSNNVVIFYGWGEEPSFGMIRIFVASEFIFMLTQLHILFLNCDYKTRLFHA